MVALLDGLPAGLRLDVNALNGKLRERQQGFGRSQRMQIEMDEVEVLSGVRGGVTIGAPLALLIRNKDWENWKDRPLASVRVTRPRPGHADLAGVLKFGHTDVRNVLERASARDTAARVAGGAAAAQLLAELDIQVTGYVTAIGGVSAHPKYFSRPPTSTLLKHSPVRCPDPQASTRMMEVIRQAGRAGDTVGGVFEVVVTHLPPGLGSYTQWDKRLDGRLAQALMSIPAIKGVEIGLGFASAARRGSAVHDEIAYRQAVGYDRLSHRSGGLEGGVTTGGPLLLRAAMKPIATLRRPLRSVDIVTKQPVQAAHERSDVCAVPAASVVGEAMTALVLADALLEKFGGDSLVEVKRNLRAYLRYLKR